MSILILKLRILHFQGVLSIYKKKLAPFSVMHMLRSSFELVILFKIAMSTSTLDAWFCCLHCKTRFAPFNGLIKELASHRSREKCWFLFRDNVGLMNVNFEGRKAID
ncbi:unnamed protein product, partial [Vitis vinifera]